MNKILAVVTGGNSSEYVISVKSADTIIEALNELPYVAYRVEIKDLSWVVHIEDGETIPIDKNDFSFQLNNKKILFDAALIMIHGNPGEDGKLQGYFDMLKIPYTASGVLTSSLTFSKHFTKQYLKSYQIQSADWVLLNKRLGFDLQMVEEKIGFPCFVKPDNAGSSFGVSKVNSFEQLEEAVEKALEEDEDVLVEKMMEGTEITCGVLRTSEKSYTFPVTEIVSKTGFFDYDAKYTVGLAEEIVPARIPDDIAKQCQDLSMRIYDIFKCNWFARVDFILTDKKLNVLEINTIPGMSKESLVPKMLQAANVNLSGLLEEILSDLFV